MRADAVAQGQTASCLPCRRVQKVEAADPALDEGAPVRTQDWVFVRITHGIGARLLTGCDVGEECLIAAGAVVTEGRRIPSGSVVMGIPAKVVRSITAEEVERTRAICAHYLEMAQRYALGANPPPWLR